MKKIKWLLVVVLQASLLSSCAYIQKLTCNKDYAAKKGREDLDAGRGPGGAESSCEGEYSTAQFRSDYMSAYTQRKSELCREATAISYATDDGSKGLKEKPSLGKLAICADLPQNAALQAQYQSHFLKSFCAETRVQMVAEGKAKAYSPADFAGDLPGCSAGLQNLYQEKYSFALGAQCNRGQAENIAVQEARERKNLESGLSRWKVCPQRYSELEQAYTSAFRATAFQMDQEERARIAKEQEALRQQKAAEFAKSTGTSSFFYQHRPHSASCNVAQDRSAVQVIVENPYTETLMLQGNWRLQYYNQDFQKITEDQMPEALLIGAKARKSFQKLTLPRDASYCRAEYVGGQVR